MKNYWRWLPSPPVTEPPNGLIGLAATWIGIATKAKIVAARYRCRHCTIVLRRLAEGAEAARVRVREAHVEIVAEARRGDVRLPDQANKAHSGAGRNPGFRHTNSVPAGAGTTDFGESGTCGASFK
jgi:hypothetical protein